MNHSLVRVLIDGQAWLYANQLRLQKISEGGTVTEAEFQKWQDDWKQETINLVVGDDEEQTSNNS